VAGDQPSRPAASLGEKLVDIGGGPRATVIRGRRVNLSVPKKNSLVGIVDWRADCKILISLKRITHIIFEIHRRNDLPATSP